MTLADTQELFHALATNAPGVDPARAETLLLGTPDLSAAGRIAIYADMYAWRQVDALRDEFPKLATLLGEGRFLELCEAYLRAHPSEDADLGELGRSLPAFLRELPGHRKDLADLAALERARSVVFSEAAAAPVTRQAFATLSPDAMGGARLRLVPSLRLLVLEHDAARVWRLLELGEAPCDPVSTATFIVVWRSGFDVFHTVLSPEEGSALERAAEGEPLAGVCEAFSTCESPAESAFAALASWTDEGWIAGLMPPDSATQLP